MPARSRVGRLGLGPFGQFSAMTPGAATPRLRRRVPTAPSRPYFLICVRLGKLYADEDVYSQVSGAEFHLCVHLGRLYADEELYAYVSAAKFRSCVHKVVVYAVLELLAGPERCVFGGRQRVEAKAPKLRASDIHARKPGGFSSLADRKPLKSRA